MKAADAVVNLLVLTGLALVAAGCYMAWKPLAFMVGGASLIFLAFLLGVRPAGGHKG